MVKEVGVVDEEVRVATIMQVEVEEEVEEEGVPEDLVDVPTTVEEDVVVVQDVCGAGRAANQPLTFDPERNDFVEDECKDIPNSDVPKTPYHVRTWM